MNPRLKKYLKFAVELSGAVYTQNQNDITELCNRYNSPTLGNFVFLDQAPNNAQSYRAFAIEDATNRVIIIAHRGSYSSQDVISHDLRRLAGLNSKTTIPNSWEKKEKTSNGTTITRSVVKDFCKKIMSGKEGYTFIHAGHSLGGNYSEFCVNEYKKAGNHFAISIDSTGTETTINEINNIKAVATDYEYLKSHILGLVGAPNIFNVLQPYVGRRYRVHIPHKDDRPMEQDFGLMGALVAGGVGAIFSLLKAAGQIFWFSYWYKQHQISSFLDTFSPHTPFPRLIREVSHWPSRTALIQWAAENTFFLKGKNLVELLESPDVYNLYMEALLLKLSPTNSQNGFQLGNFVFPDPDQISALYIRGQQTEFSNFYKSNMRAITVLIQSYQSAGIQQRDILVTLKDDLSHRAPEVTLDNVTALQMESTYSRNGRIAVGALGGAGLSFALISAPSTWPIIICTAIGGALLGGTIVGYAESDNQTQQRELLERSKAADQQLQERLIQIREHFSQLGTHLDMMSDTINKLRADTTIIAKNTTNEQTLSALRTRIMELQRDRANYRNAINITETDENVSVFFRFLELFLSYTDDNTDQLLEELTRVLVYLMNPDRYIQANIFTEPTGTATQQQNLSYDYDEHSPSRFRQLGEGSFGTVYLGLQSRDNIVNKVAIKRFRENLRAPIDHEKIRLLRHLTAHENIVRFVGHVASLTHITGLVMEYVPGGSLRIYLNNHDVPLSLQLRFIKQIVAGLKHLHNGIHAHHADLKTGNVLLDRELNCKISDLEMSALSLRERSRREQHTRSVSRSVHAHTQRWSAPEVINPRENHPFTSNSNPDQLNRYQRPVSTSDWQRADIYSLAITIYEVTSRRIPYDDSTLEEYPLMTRITEHHLRPTLGDGMAPLPLVTLMQHCWAHNPTDRPYIETIAAEFDQIAAQLLPPPPAEPPAAAMVID